MPKPAEVRQEPTHEEQTPAAVVAPTPDEKQTVVTETPPGKVYVPEEKKPAAEQAPSKLQLTPQIVEALEQLGLPANEQGLDTLIGVGFHVRDTTEQTRKQQKEQETEKNLGDARSKIRGNVHKSVQEKLIDRFEEEGMAIRPETRKMFKELAWVIVDEVLPMAAAMGQANTKEALDSYDAAQQRLMETFKDPANKVFLDKAYQIRDLSKRTGISPEAIAQIAREFLPEDFARTPTEPGRRSAHQVEPGGGYPFEENKGTFYNKLEKAMDALKEQGKDPSAIFKDFY